MPRGERQWFKIVKEFLWFDLPVDTRKKNETEARNVMKAAFASDNDTRTATDKIDRDTRDNCSVDDNKTKSNDEAISKNNEQQSNQSQTEADSPQPEDDVKPGRFSISRLFSAIFGPKNEEPTNIPKPT